jgi:hypothetical protein
MAEDRKPKIDLKSRLQKMGGPGGVTPPPPGAGSVPAPAMSPASVRPGYNPAPAASVPPPVGLSRPPGPARAAALDPSNPLTAVAQPFSPSRPPAAAGPAIVQSQRIEVDEDAVRQARGKAFKGGLTAGMVIAAMAAVVGWVAGTAVSQGNARSQGIRDAHDLSADLLKARDSLTQIQQKLQEGGKSLIADRKYPTDLSKQLSGMVVDFGGDKLFGRRFSGVPAETTRQLFDFITRVQALNDKKDLIVSLLTKLQKPVTEELSRPPGQLPISYVVVLDKDTPNMGVFLAPLASPLLPTSGVPSDLTFLNPRGSGNVKLPRLNGEKIPKDGAAATVVPNTFEKVCPSATHGQIAQLVSSMNSLVDDIQGQKGAEGGDAVTESKPGLAEVASKLSEQLSKVN